MGGQGRGGKGVGPTRNIIIRQMNEAERKIRKYYPKKLMFFPDGSHSQRIYTENFKKLIFQRYKRDFFHSFTAGLWAGSLQPSRIPHNLRYLYVSGISDVSSIALKKIMKQNKSLNHIILRSTDEELNARVVRYLKYSKKLVSLNFEEDLPLMSKMECRRMLKTWGKTIENINIGAEEIDTNVMEALLQLPRLRKFEFESSEEFFPYVELQKRKIAYSLTLDLKDSDSLISLMKNQPKFELTDYVYIWESDTSDISEKMSLEGHKIETNSRQKHYLYCEDIHITTEGSPKLIFQNIVSLDLDVSGDGWANSNIDQLNNLKHLSINISDNADKFQDSFEDFFKYLNKSVAPHKKLETFLIRTSVRGQKKQKKNLAVPFFEACAETLKKMHFEFKYLDEWFDAAECFYEGLKKLKNLQALSLFLDFREISNEEAIEKLCEAISKIKSLKEVDFNIRKNGYQGNLSSLQFPAQLERLSLGMETSAAPFDSSTTIWPLSKLTHMQFEFTDFSSPKWSKTLHDIINQNKCLEVLVLKKTEKKLSKTEEPQMKERLNALMQESSHLKLIIFAIVESAEMMILKKKNYLWSDINPIINDLSFSKSMKTTCLKSYQ